jgi:imidazolonepropionase-like amidohydrolase
LTFPPTDGTDLITRARPGRTLLIPDVTVIDGRGGPPVADRSILIRDGSIVAISARRDLPVPADAEVIEGAGSWVIPGLFDCHMHLNGDAVYDAYRRYLTPSPERKLLNAARDAAALIRMGFTTIRDIGKGYGVPLRGAIADGLLIGPRILAANSALSTTSGHGDWTIFPYAWAKEMGLRGDIVDGVDECRRAVRLALRGGADFIKVFSSGGGVTNHAHDLASYPEFSDEELAAIVEEAHRHGVRVAAHAVGTAAVRAVVRAGVDSVEHGVFDPEPDLLAEMAERGISLVPTLLIFRWVVEEGRQAGVFPEGIAAAARTVDKQHAMIRAALAAGVNIALGTDGKTVIGADRSGWELELLCEAGLTPLQALQAGTRNSAATCGLEKTLGTIEVGKLADLVVLREDPIARIAALKERKTIGRVIQAPHAIG